MFSKNIPARSRENAVFMKIWYRIKNLFFKEKVKFQNKKTHKFFKCPGCRKTLRVPKGKGRIYITCPKCGERFTKKT
jgi:ribosomal protein L37AE/L43A